MNRALPLGFTVMPARVRSSRRKPSCVPYFQLLCAQLRPLGIPDPQPEFRFAPERRWRFDFAWPDAKLALEIDGGLWINGGHNRGKALIAQYEKQNAATLLGWRVLRYAPDQITRAADDIGAALTPPHTKPAKR